MSVQQQVEKYLTALPEAKQTEMRKLHSLLLQLILNGKLWFDDGKDDNNKTVTNPTIGYGSLTMKYASGKTREVFRIGLSATSTGISVYLLGLNDKKHLADTYEKRLGKAKVTGYCISFKTLNNINLEVLEEALKFSLSGGG